jgi:hypothetical protein
MLDGQGIQGTQVLQQLRHFANIPRQRMRPVDPSMIIGDPKLTGYWGGAAGILWQVLRTKRLKIGHQVTPIPWQIGHLWLTQLTALALGPLLQNI